ncbi:mechanosensitive ion channel family protein [Ilyobacter polytropus]|uniref:MscS Mechanosensitive ion channel n=1 Tax=Ilyobacter polytropus (strain ATCC 51220 / DSM 2926 / LMG 16218 / CuHBu1) TaxID=572544 RepID=E3HBW0_ILYPC|nr:mechanosensitive ion channel domain-containing protein [Ilyobacter polytropus]ADO84286.1 MscS Mechanosensitive ion channel [Ilyobacter polytropus DSM 2926]
MENMKLFITSNFADLFMKLLGAIVIFIIGKFVINNIMALVHKAMYKRKTDPMVHSFAVSCLRSLSYVILVIITASVVGIQMTSLVAILGAATFAVGLALQGSLSNFAGGVLILIFKPFEIGHYIEAAGHSGTVEGIQIFYTVLNTPDNKKIIIPNGELSNNSLINYSKNDKRRVDIDFGISYGDDFKKAISFLNEIAHSHEKVLKDDPITIRVKELGDSSVNITYRVWCRTADYWTVYFDSIEKAKEIFDREKIEIPFPQMDVNFNPKNMEK